MGFRVYLLLRRRFGDPIPTPLRWAVIAGAIAGAALGSKLLFWFEDPAQTLQHLHDPVYFLGGKTIVGALAVGLLAVELMKHYIGVQQSTGDLYAIPLALGIAIGRIGCFLTGLADNTYGIPTNLPWGIDFGDGLRRHPTQLYEIIFLLALIPLLYEVLKHIVIPSAGRPSTIVILSGAVTKRSAVTAESKDLAFAPGVTNVRLLPGDAFKLFMVAYMSFRLFVDFLKPYPRLLLGLGAIQWTCLFILLYYSSDILRWLRPFPQQLSANS